METAVTAKTPATKRLVWDLPLRLFHWLFGLAITAAWITAEWGEEQLHMWIGYFILGLLIFRILWGIWGTRHSRFRHFFPRPGTLITYVKQMSTSASRQSVGHNPAGSLMVVLMLLLVGLQVVTGLFTEGEIWAGPYASAVDSALVKKLDDIHHANFNYLLAAIGIHIIAVLFYLLVKKQNLISPMIMGCKDASLVPEAEAISGSKLLRAFFTLAVVAGFVYWLVLVAPPPVVYDYY